MHFLNLNIIQTISNVIVSLKILNILLKLFGLLMDGVTAAMQVHVNSKIKPTTYQVMFGINLFASIALIGCNFFT